METSTTSYRTYTQQHQQDINLSDFVNVGKLEHVLTQLLHKMDVQQQRIDALESQLKVSVPLQTFQQLSQRLESTIEHFQTQFNHTTDKINELQGVILRQDQMLDSLPGLREMCERKCDESVVEQRIADLKTRTDEQVQGLKSEKANKQIVSSLEASQHRLVEEIIAIQKLLSCKIDRIEIPLLDVASEKLQMLLDFQINYEQKMEGVEKNINQLVKECAMKENKESIIIRMQNLQEILNKKVDISFLKEQVLTPFHKSQDDITKLLASEEMLEKLVEDYYAHVEKFARTEKNVQELKNDTQKLSRTIQTVTEDLSQKADFKSIDSIVFENSSEIEKIMQTYESKTAHEQKVQHAYITDVRTQIKEIQEYQNLVDQRLQVALRFIDWFTDVKLKHM